MFKRETNIPSLLFPCNITDGPDYANIQSNESAFTVREYTNFKEIKCTASCVPTCVVHWNKNGTLFTTGPDKLFTRAVIPLSNDSYIKTTVTDTPNAESTPFSSTLTMDTVSPISAMETNSIDGRLFAEISSSSLSFVNISRESSGNYTCTAVNNATGNTSQSTITIDVTCKKIVLTLML